MGEKKNEEKSKLIYKNNTSLIRIDSELHKLLKIKAAREKTTLKSLIEGFLAELLAVENKDHYE